MRPRLTAPGLPSTALSAAVALLFAAVTWPLYSVDVPTYLLPWLRHIRAVGPLAAFAEPFGNYSPPYLYLMAATSPLASLLAPQIVLKLLSYAGHLTLVAAVARLFAALGHRQPWRAAMLAGLAPSLFANPAILVQCDALWAAALIAALTAAIERRHAAMFAWCGLAFAIKLQAGFAAPFFLALALARGVPPRLWLLAPLAAIGALVPAWALGWPLGDLLTIYLRQSRYDEAALALNAPNLWMIGQALGGAGGLARLALAATAAACAGLVALLRRRLVDTDATTLLRAALLCALIVPGLLPRMHERYFFLSDVLALVLALARPAEWRLALLTQAGSCLAILAYLTGLRDLAIVGAVPMMIATWSVARPFAARAVCAPRAWLDKSKGLPT